MLDYGFIGEILKVHDMILCLSSHLPLMYRITKSSRNKQESVALAQNIHNEIV